MGGIDRTARAVVGLAIIGVGVALGSWWGLIGLLPLGTALVGNCALYTVLGISTRKAPAGKPAAS